MRYPSFFIRILLTNVEERCARFTDNFFDLLPGQTKKVIITSDKLKKNEKVDITIKQLSDTN